MENILVILLAILAFLSIVVGFWQMFVYIKLSWARRDNSKGFNGLEIAREVLDKSGDQDIEVKSAFWSLTYVDYSSSKKLLKLGKIDSRRKSLWTVATTGRQAFSAHILKKAKEGEKPPISVFWFKLQTFWFGLFMSMLFNFGILVTASLWIQNSSNNENMFNFWFWAMLLIILVVPFLYSFASFKTSKLMLENINNIFEGIFLDTEIDQIKKLWKLEYINSIIEMVKLLLIAAYTLLKAIAAAKSDN